jgi:DNA-binding transcriptional MerR regulator
VTWVSDPGQSAPARPPKSAAAFRTIGEAADELDVPAHVLRFWETRFPQIRPVKRSGGRRYYRPEDIELLRRIRHWLYQDGYTIRGVQQLLENQPPQIVAAGTDPDMASPFTAAPDGDADALVAADIASETEADAAKRLRAPGPEDPVRSDPHREPASLDPATRAELEAIRRELQQARALLDDLLRPSRNS